MQQQFTKNDVEIINRECVYQQFFAIEKVALRHRLFNGGWSQPITRELFVRGRAVAAVLYDPKHRLIALVEQFRIGLLDSDTPQESPWCREVVAGMAEANESDDDVILREIKEESGVVPDAMHTICEYYSSPGGTNERLTLYCAMANLQSAEGIFGLPEEGEDIQLVVLPQDEVFSALYGGTYNNAATLICLQWLMMNHERMREKYHALDKSLDKKVSG